MFKLMEPNSDKRTISQRHFEFTLRLIDKVGVLYNFLFSVRIYDMLNLHEIILTAVVYCPLVGIRQLDAQGSVQAHVRDN